MYLKLCSNTKSKKLLAFVAKRTFSTTSRASQEQSKPVVINENLLFHSAINSNLAVTERPIVLLYSWLVAKAKHIYKYGDFYLDKGFDVLHVKVMPDQLLKPVRAQIIAGKVLDFINDSTHSTQPILYHGFSVGGYLYGETLVKILDKPDSYGTIGERVKGQVVDSPVDFEGIPRGVSQAVTKNIALQRLLFTSIEKYLQLFYNSTTKHYLRSSEEFKTNKLGIPSLFMYSLSDRIAMSHIIQDCIRQYQENGIHVHEHCFADSDHVGHFHKHPEKYMTGINDFLEHITLVKDGGARIN